MAQDTIAPIATEHGGRHVGSLVAGSILCVSAIVFSHPCLAALGRTDGVPAGLCRVEPARRTCAPSSHHANRPPIDLRHHRARTAP